MEASGNCLVPLQCLGLFAAWIIWKLHTSWQSHASCLFYQFVCPVEAAAAATSASVKVSAGDVSHYILGRVTWKSPKLRVTCCGEPGLCTCTSAWLTSESRWKYGMFQIWLCSLCNWESSSLQIDPFLLRSLKCALSLSGSLKLRVTIKTNYISAAADSSSFLSCSAFTCSGPTHPPVFLPHQPVTALCSLFDSSHQCTPKSISTLGRGQRCAHTGFTQVPHVSVPMTTEPVWHEGALWSHGMPSVSINTLLWGLLYFKYQCSWCWTVLNCHLK